MSSFYGYLKVGDAKGEALKRAKLDFLDEIVSAKTHPRYWAGLIISGDQQALNMDKPFLHHPVKVALVVAGFLLLLLIAIKWFVGKRK